MTTSPMLFSNGGSIHSLASGVGCGGVDVRYTAQKIDNVNGIFRRAMIRIPMLPGPWDKNKKFTGHSSHHLTFFSKKIPSCSSVQLFEPWPPLLLVSSQYLHLILQRSLFSVQEEELANLSLCSLKLTLLSAL